MGCVYKSGAMPRSIELNFTKETFELSAPRFTMHSGLVFFSILPRATFLNASPLNVKNRLQARQEFNPYWPAPSAFEVVGRKAGCDNILRQCSIPCLVAALV